MNDEERLVNLYVACEGPPGPDNYLIHACTLSHPYHGAKLYEYASDQSEVRSGCEANSCVILM